MIGETDVLYQVYKTDREGTSTGHRIQRRGDLYFQFRNEGRQFNLALNSGEVGRRAFQV